MHSPVINFAPRWIWLIWLWPLPAVCAAAPSAAVNFEKNCAGCHGADGKAQTRLGRKAGAKDLTDKSGAGRRTDAEIFQTIKFGRKDRNGEVKMESFGKELSDPEITELVAYVRRFTK